MKIYEETRVRYFNFWAGAEDTVKQIDAANAWDTIEEILEDIYPDGVEDVALNDLFRFDGDTVLEWAGIKPEEIEEE